MDELEENVNAARKDVGSVSKELQAANKAINQLEASIESEQASRHSLLLQCKLNNILIPIKSGSLDDIDEDGGGEESSMEMSAR